MKFLVTIACAALAAAAPAAKSPKTKESHNKHGKIKAMDTDAPNGNKKGLVYNDGNVIGAFNGAASWAYNWAAALDAPGVQGIPMCWGGGVDCDANGINAKIDQGNTPWVLGYNEPDMPRDAGGSLMTPQQAYDSWGNDMFRFRDRGVKLVCPGISSYDTDNSQFTGFASGLTWLRQWANTNGNPAEFGCEAQALHWYGAEGVSGADQGQLFITYIENAHNTVNEIFGREMDIWVTEFSPVPTGEPTFLSDFLAVTIPWLNAQNYVARYSPFKAEFMVNADGSLNQAGQTFANTSK